MSHEIKEIKEEIGVMQKTLLKMEQILEIIVVELKGEVKDLKNKTDNMQTAIFSSCDAKTKEIDEKVNEGIEKESEVINKRIDDIKQAQDKRILQIAGSVAGLFILFTGAVVYFNNYNTSYAELSNNKHEELGTKSDLYHQETIKNSAKLDMSITLIKEVKDELKKATAQRYKIAEEGNK